MLRVVHAAYDKIRYSLAGQDARPSPERPGLESRWRNSCHRKGRGEGAVQWPCWSAQVNCARVPPMATITLTCGPAVMGGVYCPEGALSRARRPLHACNCGRPMRPEGPAQAPAVCCMLAVVHAAYDQTHYSQAGQETIACLWLRPAYATGRACPGTRSVLHATHCSCCL